MAHRSSILHTLPGLADVATPRANLFIVTIYGDVVEPRGDSLWMGSLIDVCAEVGISESLVRTAVSRLVQSGHLEGDRVGRKSFYRLTPRARLEFVEAAELFYAPLARPDGLLVALDRDAAPGPGPGWAAFAPRHYLGPDREDAVPPDGVVFRAQPAALTEDLRGFAQRLWSLDGLAEEYAAFLRLFEPLSAHVAAGQAMTDAQALAARLYLVHRYRLIVLRDPRLPRALLPADWPGDRAWQAFSELYLALAGPADRQVAATFRDGKGTLPAQTEKIARRQVGLSGGLSRAAD